MRIFAMKLSFWKGPGSFCEAVLKSGIRGVLLMRLFLKLKYNVASCFIVIWRHYVIRKLDHDTNWTIAKISNDVSMVWGHKKGHSE